MTSPRRKTGRPVGYHMSADGTRINGLTRRADGRWKISATGKTFVEPDEALAIARFYELTTGESNHVVMQSVTVPVENTYSAIAQAMNDNATVEVTNTPDGQATVTLMTSAPAFYAAVRYQLLHNLDELARLTGVPALLQLQNDMPRPSPTLQELVDLYAAKPGLSHAEVTRSKLFWKEFCEEAGVASVREITHDAVIRYEKKVLAGGYSPKYIHHRYGKIRTILAHAIKRGCGIEDCRRALDCTALLEVKNHTPLDPKPIAPEQFWKVHAEAVKAGDNTFATLMLMALNAAMYGGEVSALKWEEVNMQTGELVTRRPKTSVSRVCVLWPEVLAGLRKLVKQGDHIFYAAKRSYYVNAVVKAWKKYRTAAELGNDLKFGQLRDAAFTIANNVSLDQARVLAGHRIGQADHYIRRNPQFVAPACQAIHGHFYPTKKSKTK